MKISRVVAVAVAAFLIAGGLTGAQDMLSDESAKADQRRRLGHFSRWSPPLLEELPAEAKVHIVIDGDTLWDLATSYLGDPYYWPQLWQENLYIGDPHWIYPGDPVVIPMPKLVTEVQPVEDFLDFDALPPPRPVAKRVDVYCAPQIIPLGAALEDSLEASYADAEIRLAASEVNQRGIGQHDGGNLELLPPTVDSAPAIAGVEQAGKINVGEGEVIYVNRGETHGVSAGDEFFILRPARRVYHPDDRSRLVGMAMQSIGQLRILCTQERTSTARIIDSCTTALVGDLLRPYEPIPIPLASQFEPTPERCAVEGDQTVGSIVYAKDMKVALAAEDIVNIDLGTTNGIVPGDFLTIFRRNHHGSAFPNAILGDLVVLLVREETATGKIMVSSRDISVGDRVRLR